MVYNKTEVLDLAGRRVSGLLDDINKVSTPQQAIIALDNEMRILRSMSDVLNEILSIKGTLQ